MSLPPLLPLALFMTAVLLLGMYGLAVSGHFPAEHRKPALQSTSGAVLLWGTLLLAAAITIAVVLTAVSRLSWPVVIIGGGLMQLLAPLVLQLFPDHIGDGRAGLVGLAGGAAMLTAIFAM